MHHDRTHWVQAYGGEAYSIGWPHRERLGRNVTSPDENGLNINSNVFIRVSLSDWQLQTCWQVVISMSLWIANCPHCCQMTTWWDFQFYFMWKDSQHLPTAYSDRGRLFIQSIQLIPEGHTLEMIIGITSVIMLVPVIDHGDLLGCLWLYSQTKLTLIWGFNNSVLNTHPLWKKGHLTLQCCSSVAARSPCPATHEHRAACISHWNWNPGPLMLDFKALTLCCLSILLLWK